MGAIGGMLGLSGGAAGTGFASPQAANITNPVTAAQIASSYAGTQDSMESQKQLLSALQAQNGLGNQTQVYNQLQGVAAGTGPNPAQAMLAQSTGANVANQAALMAGQRGASGNVGMMARQAGQQGGAIQQQAAGQAATLQANQSLNAINSAGGMANVQAGNQVGQTNANVQAQQAQQQALLNAQTAYNNAQVGSQTSMNSGNASLAGQQMQGQQGMIGGILGGIGRGFGSLAEGGVVHNYAEGTPDAPIAAQDLNAPQSKFGKFLKAGLGQSEALTSMGGPAAAPQALNKGAAELGSGLVSMIKGRQAPAAPAMMAGEAYDPDTMMAARGGMVQAVLSPGEKYLKPNEAAAVAKGKESADGVGKVVPGKPKFKGNNYANDVVPAKLEEGGVVIPNSVMQSKDPVRGAADFVRAALAKKGKRS